MTITLPSATPHFGAFRVDEPAIRQAADVAGVNADEKIAGIHQAARGQAWIFNSLERVNNEDVLVTWDGQSKLMDGQPVINYTTINRDTGKLGINSTGILANPSSWMDEKDTDPGYVLHNLFTRLLGAQLHRLEKISQLLKPE